ncbi:SMI1/KNR4 family protein [Tsukamurella tyrosinosolvens]|uniref:SMI1/KNR4 family protein n=1 Tax=Tsukamurella tyrosinosolvens TaxID=57704 RepID=UPI002DD41E25|nr:SMI1/KNR4 family protein [Tsukamurella tyrosinosolvens]MEC4615617.1 SMI1/KNR4 family protein [Tsukamurella tyrosinosolvens]
MNTDVGVARWRELIDAIGVQKERLVRADPDLYEMSQPNPGATEEQLLAAEERLGYRIPAQYREFLTVANGWNGWGGISGRLLGSDAMSGGSGFEVSIRQADNTVLEWETDADWVRIEDDPLTMVLHRDSQGYPVGSVLRPVYGDRVYGTFEEYVTEHLAELTAWADRASLGPHGAAWGRDLREAEPTLEEIVRRLVDAQLDLAMLERRVEAFVPPGAPATAEQVVEVERVIGRSLHPEHRKLLLLMNGWPGIPYILSTAEIINGERWRATLAEQDRFDADHRRTRNAAYAAAGIPIPEDPPAASARAASIDVVPFAAWAICTFGVDPDDGFVRWVPLDTKYAEDPHGTSARSAGTVREYLLSEIDQLHDRIEGRKRAQQQSS